MSLISEHRKARNNKSRIVFHEFKVRYKKNNKIIYGFVEGIDDPAYYRGFIENYIPDDWDVELWPSGGRDQVLEIFDKIDWRKFKRKKILFFIDRDLSDLLEDKIILDKNIYITDGYSIENSIVNKSTCNRVLREICGLNGLKHEDYETIINIFYTELDKFKIELIPIMSSILFWQNNRIKACYNDIQMNHIFSIKNGLLNINKNPKNNENLIEYVHKQCNIDKCEIELISLLFNTFTVNHSYKKFTRGKYLLWFLVEFCLSIYKDYNSLNFLKIPKKPKMVVNLSHSNSVVQIAPRCRIPSTLKSFFEVTISEHIDKHITRRSKKDKPTQQLNHGMRLQ